MLIEETIEKLLSLRLPTMAAATREVLQSAPSEQLSFEDKLGLVVDREWSATIVASHDASKKHAWARAHRSSRSIATAHVDSTKHSCANS